MEQDRFKMNSKLYVLGMICLVLSLGLFFLSLYILPYLIWQLHYKMPTFILDLLAKFEDDYNYSIRASRFIVWLLFFIPSLITGCISYFVSNYIDNQIYEPKANEFEDQVSSQEVGKEIKESASFGLKILGLMVLIVIIILLLQFVIQFTV
jgi:p-aminobenzoyl-glutamate transporter AbgT